MSKPGVSKNFQKYLDFVLHKSRFVITFVPDEGRNPLQNRNHKHQALDITVKSEVMKKVFESINPDIEEVAEFIENNGLSFVCNEEMNVEASEEDFNKLIEQFPELDYVEL